MKEDTRSPEDKQKECDQKLKEKNLYWIVEAKQTISKMVRECMVQPTALLDKYKKYEYILNVESKEAIDTLFNQPSEPYQKMPLEEIEKEILRYHEAEEEILNISNNHVDFPMFRVEAVKLKRELRSAAKTIKQKIMSKTYDWCNSKVEYISKTYIDMENTIKKVPEDERQLVEI